jgi:hypothetical protein
MTSEKEFANGFGGFWSECLPFLTPQLVSEMNLARKARTSDDSRIIIPFSTGEDNSQNAFIAETAFELFANTIKTGKDVLTLAEDQKLLADVASNSISRLLGLKGYWRSIKQKFPKTATEESIALAVRMEDFFSGRPKERPIVIQPRFKGCGILDSCYGDILAGSCLYESKMVERNLRSADLRQLLIYCALNYLSHEYVIDRVAVLNVRRAAVYEFTVDALSRRAARKSAPEVFHQIEDFLSNFETLHPTA